MIIDALDAAARGAGLGRYAPAPVETVYVAFDRRVRTVPPWLEASFTPVSGAILKSTEKPSPEPGSPNVQYQLYEPKNPSAFANAASFDDHADGFSIDRFSLDEDHWAEGFVDLPH